METSKAQLCTGSLGDPVINITFGSGPNPGPALNTTSTGYGYVTSGCPSDGFYTIANSTSGCFSSTWHTLTQDHTPGDVNGYMMLVNSSYQPSVFYLDTVRNLCGGTTFEFSAWIMSVLLSSACNGNGNMPNITFSIETTTGTVIQTYNTGNIPNLPAPQWAQYGFFFTLPLNVSDIVLRMANNAPGGCGNDLALDDITFRPCGPKVNAAFANAGSRSDTANFCFSDNASVTISGSVQSGYINPSFQWQQSLDSGASWQNIAGATTSTYTNAYPVPGIFLYRMMAAESGNINLSTCRVISNTLTIIIDTTPTPQTTNSSPVCALVPVTLGSANAYTYLWSGPNGFSATGASPVINSPTVNSSGEYYVTASSKGGCKKLDSTLVVINSLPPANAGSDVKICEGSNTSLEASGGVHYIWTPSLGLSDPTIANPQATPSVTTTYTVTVTSAINCMAKDSVLVTVLYPPVANAGPDKRLINGQTVMLNGTASGDTANYFWTPVLYINNATTTLTPLVNPVSDITYTLHVVSASGCGVSTDDVFVRVFQKVTIPNAFSPNGDGINDVWNIDGLNTYPESETLVYNRFGQLVLRSKGYSKPWDGKLDGKPLPVGTYYYTIDRKNDFPLLSGWIMLIR